MDALLNLNQYQQQAVTHSSGPALVLAGAGSGKTRCLIHRVAYLINQIEVKPDSIVLLTFTNKAADEMKSRVNRLIGRSIRLGFSGTFHSFGALILRQFTPFAGRSRGFVIYDDQDSKALLTQIIKDLSLNHVVKPAEAYYYLNLIKRRLIEKDNYMNIIPSAKAVIKDVILKYEASLRQNNAFDFGDLLYQTYFLIHNRPEARQMLEARYRHFLVDEYQDTNFVQYQLLKLLTRKSQNIFAVGDFSQAIYKFRGADYHNINRLKEDHKQLTIFKLPTNYRSIASIIQAASHLIKHNTTHPTLNLKPTRQGKTPLTLLPAYDDEHEALRVVRMIIEAIDTNQHLGEIAILYRTHTQSRLFEEFLIKSKLPYHIIGGWRFFERKEIKDLMAYMRLFYFPDDGLAYKRALKLGKRRLNKFLDWRQGIKDKKLTTQEVLNQIIKISQYTQKLDETLPEDKARLDNIFELVNFADSNPNFVDFFEKASLFGHEEVDYRNRWQASGDKINLMTVHAAKGLEFKTVFITGLEAGLFPHFLSKDIDEVEEERRLFYVALTRAKNKVYLSYAGRRRVWGRYQNQKPSPFLEEIPDDLIEVEEL